ncbi:two-component system chemotaxis response regulator CheB [Azospirillum lipoferum]|uniref:protein-glutamate methylesterase n=1 Tax=Azospirillum lipoferum TaxID=193 RepID=A0A5A9GHP4_AZOLI|nr:MULTISPECIES: chemotaxis protein CheB [Azospirillum]KAA0593951.1 chemotaxis protein CheB [Azospirillum lipoferum]MCP1612423.1 two-component system chemotaxis response regulator CheB [Azospirillum lipoferum]MDW5531793.1 chemotaxis protein CheB [Azospirillum sp. NL1]
MEKRDIITIGASAGGLTALRRLFGAMPKDCAPTVFVVLHITPNARSVLPLLLDRIGWLPAFHPHDGEPIRPGHIHVAPPDHHLLVHRDRVLIRRGPRENRTRPAVDPLFRSAGVAFGSRVVGVVLSGTLDDGTSGLRAIRRCGGIGVAQDPDDAEWPGMPQSAIDRGEADHVLPLDRMPALLSRLAAEPAPPSPPVPFDIATEARIAEQEFTTVSDDTQTVGKSTTLSCPECGGGLSEIHDGPVLRFRCQVGHAFSPDSMEAAQAEAMENALWVALRTHEDRVELFRRLGDHARERGQTHLAATWDKEMREARRNAELLRAVLSKPEMRNTSSPKTR